MLVLRESDVRSLLTMRETVRCVEAATLRQAEGATRTRPRERVRLPSGTLNVLPAADLDLGVAGLKTYIAVAGGARFAVLLFDLDSADLRCLIEADTLGMMRTGAASAVATKHMVPAGRRHTVAVVGAGWQARGQVAALHEVLEIDEVRVFSRSGPRQAAFASWVGDELGLGCVTVGAVAEATAGASVVCTATNSAVPVLDAGAVEPGTHINAVGANSLVRRELTDELVAKADVIVVDSRVQAQAECGDLFAALQLGRRDLAELLELGEVVSGRHPGRTGDADITIFESHGLGLHDVAVAAHIYERALEAGAGEEIAFADGTLAFRG